MIQMKTTAGEGYQVLHLDLGEQPVAPTVLADLTPPASLLTRRHEGLILSGRAPVWLYAWLTHWAHPFAWVATYDPRLGGAVVVTRHTPTAPEVGTVVGMDENV